MNARRFQNLLTLAALVSLPISVYSQGSLVPPGPPAPTMKSLSQIEPRTLIASLPFQVTAPGSYYLTTNLTGLAGSNGIVIDAENVTLDLNGFTLYGVPGSLNGITTLNPRRNITIKNGSLKGWTTGVNLENAASSDLLFLRSYDNAVDGLKTGPNSRISDSVVESNQGNGINAGANNVLEKCVARGNLANGIKTASNSKLSHCVVSHSTGSGIVLENDAAVVHCVSSHNVVSGIVGGQNVHLVESTTANNTQNGIQLTDNCTVNNCAASTNGQSGILTGASSQVLHTRTQNNKIGIQVGDDSTLTGVSSSNNSSDGIITGGSSQIIQCKSSANGGVGIRTNSGSTVKACSTLRNGSDGILFDSECSILENHSIGNFNARDAAGLHAIGTDNNIKDNNAVSNDRGIACDVAGNIIMRNTTANNSINYFVPGNHFMGPILDGTNSVEFVNPWSNFAF